MTLDPKRTFDELIGRLAPDAGAREQILANRVYRELSGAIAGSQEFTAVAKLAELAQEERFDLLVLDTPPSRNALDFLDAPDRLTQFLEGRALRGLLGPTGAGARLLGRGAGFALGLLRRITGADLLRDLSEFFRLLGGLLGGFRERAAQVDALLHDPATAFVLVSSPEPEPVEEAIWFARRLHEARMTLAGALVNRVHADALEGEAPPDLAALLRAEAGLSVALAARVVEVFTDEHALARRDDAGIVRLAAQLGDEVALLRVPQLDEDVHDAGGLAALQRHLS
jgi:anion-transporting  ArsA/GET3 family ATPase